MQEKNGKNDDLGGKNGVWEGKICDLRKESMLKTLKTRKLVYKEHGLNGSIILIYVLYPYVIMKTCFPIPP